MYQRTTIGPVFWLAILLGGLMGASTALAQGPQCDRQAAGLTACLGAKLCECRHFPGGTLTAAPEGYRWDCGVLRPSCGYGAGAPATLNPYLGPYPSAVSMDRDNSVTIIRQDQDNENTNRNTSRSSNENLNKSVNTNSNENSNEAVNQTIGEDAHIDVDVKGKSNAEDIGIGVGD